HVAAPEGRKALALDAHVFHVLGLLGLEVIDRGVLLIERDAHDVAARGIERHGDGPRVEVARLARPLLPFPLVGRELHGVAVAARERFVAIDQRLHAIAASRELGERMDGIAERRGVHIASLPGPPALDIHTEYLRRLRGVAYLKARLAAAVSRDEQQQSPVNWSRAALRRKRDDEPEP